MVSFICWARCWVLVILVASAEPSHSFLRRHEVSASGTLTTARRVISSRRGVAPTTSTKAFFRRGSGGVKSVAGISHWGSSNGSAHKGHIGQPPRGGTIAVYVKAHKRFLHDLEFVLIPSLLSQIHFETAVTILFDGDLKLVFSAAKKLQGHKLFWPLHFVNISHFLAPSQDEVSMLKGADVRMRASGMPVRKLYEFWAVHAHMLPELSRYRYLWRLETDTNITKPVAENVYDVMSTHDSVVGYLLLQKANKEACQGLQRATQDFFKIDSTFTPVSSDADIFLQSFEQRDCPHWRSNFQLMDLNFLRMSKTYTNYTMYLQRKVHGFVKYRWGTHLVQTLSVLLEVPPQRTLCLRPWIQGFKNRFHDPICQVGVSEPKLVEMNEL